MSDQPERQGSRNSTRTVIIVVAAAVLLLLLTCCALAIGANLIFRGSRAIAIPERLQIGAVSAEQVREETFDTVETPLVLVVENEVGTVRVVGSDRESVVVEATARAYGATRAAAEENLDRVSVMAEQVSPTRIAVSGAFPQPWIGGQSPQVEFVIRVPGQTSVQITTNVGEVTVEDLEGEARIQTSVGDVNVNGFRGMLDLGTSVGDVDVRGWTMLDDSRLSTRVGDIDARLAGSPSFRLDAQTNVGRISSSYDVEGEHNRDRVPGETLQGTVGDAPNVRLTLRTNTGSIRLSPDR